MADLLLELFSEEIPARMQARAAEDLKKRVTDALVAEGFLYEGAVSFVTPRRLTLSVHGLPRRGKDVREEKKGPRVGAPQQAIDGFLKSAGLASLDLATIESDPKKGDFYVAITEKPGRPTTEALASLLPGILRSFPWPKSMRWGASSGPAGKCYVNGEGRGAETLTWVRPLQAILCLFGEEQEEPEVVDFTIDGIRSGNVTFGHRFLADGKAIAVKRLDDYLAKLEKAKVIADPKRRRDTILHEARQLCFAQGLELVEDEGLADEVAGLVEWPVPLMGSFEEAFLEVPEEVIRTTIRANQKCFVVRDPKTGKLTNRFIATANTIAADGGALIIAGNARVIRARLSDARFFWETDKKVKLETRLEKLKSVRFHEKLGTQYERVERIAALAAEIAPSVGADPKLARKAAMLAKADLATEMVGEFPELQGFMGHRYALLEGHEPSVAAAIEDHYRPQGPSDRVPTDPVSVAVALADKLDILVGFWAIDEKPTGSKDPYALRRAALGVIRLLVENGKDIRLIPMLNSAAMKHPEALLLVHYASRGLAETDQAKSKYVRTLISSDLVRFFHDRLKVMLKDQGARHDLVDAVLGAGSHPSPLRGGSERSEGEGGDTSAKNSALAKNPLPTAAPPPSPQGGGSDDLLSIVNRVHALSSFLATDDGANLLAGYRRAANILKAEEKKDGAITGGVDAAALKEPEEKALADMLARVEPELETALAADDYQGAMQRMATLRPAVDAFFEKILVNAEDAAVRLNRLRLLSKLRAATAGVADLGRISG